jgi:uncharacterized RDD family membrane protein YckC
MGPTGEVRMQVVCARCSRALEYSGECPSFCAYCGQALRDAKHNTPSGMQPEIPTQSHAEAGSSLPVPQTVGGYRLGRPLGSGGMGTVYQAEEIATGRRLALKLINPEFAGSADAVERFRQEGRIASMIAHPRCVFVLAVDEEAGRPYIVMELMSGVTLAEMISERGPLPPEQAVAKILDVIVGLLQAHRQAVIHRDVKPSNCFLEADGRVKVGDFGLAKSLIQDAHLTKTGAFVGTPHYASPEQICGEAIDVQTDVYSVAATLYFLLTGQPPHAGKDSMATLARIVSDPAPPMRSVRPELSPALDRVVLRGLERDRSKRYSDLEAFRQALLSLAPEPLSTEGQVLRVTACLADGLLFWLVYLPLLAGLNALFGGDGPASRQAELLVLARVASLVLFGLYFLVLEHTWGCSLGKLVLGLRVCTSRSIDPPDWKTTAVRTGMFVGLIPFAGVAAALVLWLQAARLVGPGGWKEAADWIDLTVRGGWSLIGIVVLASTMRARNGYLGLHERISGTHVIRPVRPRQQEHVPYFGGWLMSFLRSRSLNRGLVPSSALPQRIAGFAIRCALKWTPVDKVLLGEDASLGRRVFLWLRPGTEPALPAVRRDVGRRTRLRWLGCGKQGEFQWDALLAPLGSPLPDWVQIEGAFVWREARVLLEELACELAAAGAEGTLPFSLTTAQVWVQPDGQAQLADLPLTATAEEESPTSLSPQQRSLELLARVLVLALEGEPRQATGSTTPLRVTLPPDAQQACERLLGIGNHYESVEPFQQSLACGGR